MGDSNVKWTKKHMMLGEMYGMIPVIQDMQIPISREYFKPHYTNPLFDSSQTIFLREGYELEGNSIDLLVVKGAHYIYSDRLPHDKDGIWDKIKETGLEIFTAAFQELYLREILGSPDLTLVHILSGVNLGNGYPYQVYGFFE